MQGAVNQRGKSHLDQSTRNEADQDENQQGPLNQPRGAEILPEADLLGLFLHAGYGILATCFLLSRAWFGMMGRTHQGKRHRPRAYEERITIPFSSSFVDTRPGWGRTIASIALPHPGRVSPDIKEEMISLQGRASNETSARKARSNPYEIRRISDPHTGFTQRRSEPG